MGRAVRSAITARLVQRTAHPTRLLAELDHRTTPVRRYNELVDQMASDLGGQDHLTEAQMQLVKSAAGLVVLRDRLDMKALNDEPVPVQDYARITNSLGRVLRTLGLKREPRNVTPDLRDYIKGKNNSRARTIDHEDGA